MKVSVIIVNYKTKELLSAAIDSVIRQTIGITYEIIVVDNASGDDTADIVSKNYPQVKIIAMSDNVGFGMANNVATKVATGDYFFFLNSDTKILNDAITILSEYLDSCPECGACGGNLVGFDGIPMHSFELRFPSPLSDLLRFLEFLPSFARPKSKEFNDTPDSLRVAYITGADLMVRADVFRTLQGFDPLFFMYYEETDLCLRVTKAGYSIYSVPKAMIAHLKGASLGGLLNASGHYYHSKYGYLRKYHGIIGILVSHAFFTSFCLLKASAYAFAGKKASKEVMLRNFRAARAAFMNNLVEWNYQPHGKKETQ